MNRTLLTTVIALVIACTSVTAAAFGPNGHRIVAQIAEDHLTPKAKANIDKITKGRPLAMLATWPDDIRSDKAWNFAKPWHFLSIDDGDTFAELKRSDGTNVRDALNVLEALERFELQLRNAKITGENRWQALAFYIHFMGDIHQPLHVGRTDDFGGNSIAVKWFGNLSNLHSVWDSGLIENQYLSFQEYADFLDGVSAEDEKQWQSSDYLDYAKESKAVRQAVYDFGFQKTQLPDLSYDYSYKKLDILNARIQRAGIRLAGRLNSIYGH